ncbi:type IV pilus secretin family protein [Candidatus Methylomicrobium oryzae]|uniref:type IV pilus secretin family protein n=1 Tax=Candidatus Methylomicrobium oryzae TaxID=2802053 RepID=UPI001921BC3B|nr:type IV pilus secretin family protein [Methylomicrobium sp. RS1]MBL1264339.1 type IV pilus secretin PilQ [Methylomicrobium sp. RS1]
MINQQNGFLMKIIRIFGAGLVLFIAQNASVKAAELAITQVDVATQAGDKLQIQLEMNGPAVAPRVFKTDNPARIALDFSGVKNGLPKKTYPINQGVVNSLYVAEAADRVRVVLNLTESAPFDTKTDGRRVLLTLTNAKSVPATSSVNSLPVTPSAAAITSQLIPQQSITGFDFKRGDKGEGRILVSLANPNTVVNTREESGNVVISFMNTQLPGRLSKRMDVSEFATPVKYIDAASTAKETTVTVSLQSPLYDYSLFQSEGLLTVEFRPLTPAEKEVIQSQRDKYTGDRLSLNFQDIDIRSVIAVLSEFTGQNVVAGDDVTGTVTVKLDDVPWDEALDFIMMTKGLEKYETGNVTLVAPVGKIKDYKEKQREKEVVIEQLDPLVTEYLKINYAKAENFKNLLNGKDSGGNTVCGLAKGSNTISKALSNASTASSVAGQAQDQKTQQQMASGGGMSPGAGMTSGMGYGQNPSEKLNMLTERGTVMVDSRTNTLIVRETAKRLDEIKKLIRKLDIPVRQVMIESRVVIASSVFARELGVRFGVAKMAQVGSGKNFALGGAGTHSFSNAQPDADGNIGEIQDTIVDLATESNPYGALGMTLARGADYVLNLELSALQDQNKAQILSNPRVMTTDRCQATITSGQSIPYETQSGNGGTNVQFIDALLALDVTPQITPSGSINMDLVITRDEPTTELVLGRPKIDINSVKTNVLVNDGETIVLGGIYRGETANELNKVPFFADLPGIGFLFKRTVNSEDKRELLVFVTPKIVKDILANN